MSTEMIWMEVAFGVLSIPVLLPKWEMLVLPNLWLQETSQYAEGREVYPSQSGLMDQTLSEYLSAAELHRDTMCSHVWGRTMCSELLKF